MFIEYRTLSHRKGYLNLSGNDLTKLDVSNNKLLDTLDCSMNYNLKSLDISQNKNLLQLHLSNIFSGSSKRIKTSMLMHWQR